MKHRNSFRKLGRTSSHRKALLKNLAISLIEHGRIETGVFKAKELRSYIEKLVSKSKNADFNTHRMIFAELHNKKAVKKLIGEIAPKYVQVNGGYIRIQRTRIRRGDASTMALIEFVA